jgi:outer membrane protein OmpA-like peptidoglycan-associated protein/chitodextrinase
MRSIALLLSISAALVTAAQESYVVAPVDISPVGLDFAPTLLTDSTVVMCSLRDRGTVAYRNARTEDPFSDMYAFKWDGYSASNLRMLSEKLSTALNDGPATFSKDGNTICFTRNQSTVDERKRRADDHLGLYFATKADGEWSDPVGFDYNSTVYNVMHASLSKDGQQLYFASDMPGGFGGTDLYRCEKEANGWSIPVNLGKELNSEASEIFPFAGPDGTLYFSSSRPGGSGGMDIYSSRPKGIRWTIPVALPEPMNSAGNDIGYTSFRTDRSGLFSSDRDGSDRIYSFRRAIPLFASCAEQVVNNYCYSFAQPDNNIIGDLPVHYRWSMGDGTTVDGEKAQHCYKGPGRYIVALDLVDNSSGEVFFEQGSYELVIEDIVQPYITCSDSLRSGRNEVLDATHSLVPDQTREEYHWDLGDGTFAEGPVVKHDWKAPGDYIVKLAILGVRNGTSQLAAQCVTKHITVIKRFEDSQDGGVFAQYQDAAGKMHDFNFQALPFDQFSMAVKENEDVRFTVQLFASKERISLDDARFTEIRKFYPVFERYDPVKGEYTYSVGQAKNLKEMYKVFQKVLELKFMDAEVAVIHTEKVTDLSALSLLSEGDMNNSIVRASTVLFETGKATFSPDFEVPLNKMAKLLNDHPQMNVVIEAHTDANGSDAENFKLSQQRAQSIMDHLIAKGTSAERMVPVGHGENHPIADNKSAAGRAKNRRVEFRLVLREDQANEKR